MNFKEWHDNNLGDDAGKWPPDQWQRIAWIAAMNSCAEMLEKEAEALSMIDRSTAFDVAARLDARVGQTALLNAVIKIRTEIANS